MKRNYPSKFQKFQLLKKSLLQLKFTPNPRHQKILIKRVKRLYKQLRNNQVFKPAIITSMIALGFFSKPTSITAQNYFLKPKANAFDFVYPEFKNVDSPFISSFADLNYDGDVDMIISGKSKSANNDFSIAYYENIGLPTDPDFSNVQHDLLPNKHPENVHETYPAIFTDLDGDGDFDILLTGKNDFDLNEKHQSQFFIYENIGTKYNPEFTTPEASPYNLHFEELNFDFITLASVDLDNDGDLDIISNNHFDPPVTSSDPEESLIYFHENIGTALNPNFKESVEIGQDIFGDIHHNKITNISLGDMDNDGDSDVLVGSIDNDSPDNPILYCENISSNTSFEFNETVVWPFRIDPTISFSMPIVVDIDLDGDQDVLDSSYGVLFFYENIKADSQETLALENISLVPNPAKDWLEIELKGLFSEEDVKIDVFDAMGNEIISLPLNKTSFDVSNLVAGAYFVSLKFETNVYYRTLVIQN